MGVQNSWRYCEKCFVMFYDGGSFPNVCPAKGTHSAQGFDFDLPHDIPETPNAQSNWRFCDKCRAMFYDGGRFPNTCPSGGAHSAQGYNFTLPHDIPPTPSAQDAWRFCDKCCSMFYAGRSEQGVCAAGGAHSAQGFTFVLSHDLPTTLTWDNLGTGTGNTTSSGSTECSYSVSLAIQMDGTCQFSGFYTNRGDVPIVTAPAQQYGVSAVVFDSNGHAYSFSSGGSLPSAPQAGCTQNWNTTQVAQPIANNWNLIAARNFMQYGYHNDTNVADWFSEITAAVASLASDVETVMAIAGGVTERHLDVRLLSVHDLWRPLTTALGKRAPAKERS
jgi:hypothetical protein